MRDPILSIRVWSYYAAVIGIGLVAVPNTVFDVLGIATTEEVWIRVVGIVTIVLAVVYWGGARGRSLDVVKASIFGRIAAVVGFVALTVTGGPWQLLIFAAMDLVGLVWSWRALTTPATASA